MKGPSESALLTDLYQLTMLQAYWQHRMDDIAVFELFVRKLPPDRAFLVAAGLEQALDFIEQARFDEEELGWVTRCGTFAPGFADWLRELRFTGDVWAMPEGTVFFANEPIVRVVAPIAEAQWLETRILNLVHFQTVIASKAARVALAAAGHPLIDFGLRRAHGAEAGVLAARAAYLAGFAGTATAYAGPRFGIPVFGTMAHSFVQAHDDEAQAFEHFAESFPANAMLLIDTYDTVEGARRVAELAPRLAQRGIRIKGVRLDSGDLDALSRAVRRVLNEAGLHDAVIFASGNLDEQRVHALVAARRADHELRRRHQPHHQQRCALSRRRLQAPGVRRAGAPQALLGQGDLARPQAGVPPTRRERPLCRRHRGAHHRDLLRRAVARRSDARRPTRCAFAPAGGGAGALRGSARHAATRTAPA